MGAGWDPEMPGTNEGLTARGTKSSLFCEEHSGCGRMEAGAPGVYGGGGGRVSPLGVVAPAPDLRPAAPWHTPVTLPHLLC